MGGLIKKTGCSPKKMIKTEKQCSRLSACAVSYQTRIDSRSDYGGRNVRQKVNGRA